MSETRHYAVGMSVEALASAWARTEHAPDGAVVVADDEIAGRLRGGVPWKLGGADALMMAMVVRPAIGPTHEALLWLVASMAAADALTDATGATHQVVWPDTVVRQSSGPAVCSMNVIVQLGPARIDHAVVAARVTLDGLDVGKERLLEPLRLRLQESTRLLESDRQGLVDRFTDCCAIMGQRVRAELVPRGEARGRAIAVDPDGFLVLESPTGMLDRVAPASLRSLSISS